MREERNRGSGAIGRWAAAAAVAWVCGSVWAGSLAQIRTPLGAIDVELFSEEKPATVANFIRYVESGRYEDMFFHRLDPNFVLQGGGFRVTQTADASQIAGVPTFGQIVNEYSVGPELSNSYGTLAMARVGGQTNSATSQWFFNLRDNPFLDAVDGGFTVFARVVGGTNVLNRFNEFQRGASTNLVADLRGSLGSAFGEVPLLSSNLTYDDLVYARVVLLKAEIRALGGGEREISWANMLGRAHRLEATPAFGPPAWETLVTTNGRGDTLRYIDRDPVGSRLYRVRVDY